MRLETLARDLRYTFRSLRRTPAVSLTIVATVALGLGLVTVVFTLLNSFIFRVDEVRNPHEMFEVERQQSERVVPDRFTRAEFDALLRETGVFTSAYARMPGIDTWVEGRRMEAALVTGNFFEVLGVSAAIGRTLTPLDDTSGGTRAIVLSHRTWSQQFAADPGVVTRTVLLNNAPFHIVGVMPAGFRGLTVAPPDFWAPLALAGEFTHAGPGGDDRVGLHVVGRLKPGVSRDRALAELLVWDSNRHGESAAARSMLPLVLEPRLGTAPQRGEAMVVFSPLFFAFGLILLIGCANVANLLLARGVARQREIGIRLAIGASRRRVVGQLLTENLVLSLVSAGAAFGISRAVLSAFVEVMTSTFPPEFGDIRLDVPPADWRVGLFLVIGALVSTLLFALAPALQATRVELLRAVRGEIGRVGRPGRARNALVALQVTASALLLICAGVFLRSSWASSTVDPGIRTADTVSVILRNEERRGVVLDMLKHDPLVESVAASWPQLDGHPGFADGSSGRSPVTYQFVSPEYFDVLGLELLRGRGFTENERSERASVAVVTESAARQLWPARDALGEILQLEPDSTPAHVQGDDPRLSSRRYVVVGVLRDVAGIRLGGFRMAGAGIYVPIDARAPKTSLILRVRGDSERSRNELVDRFAAIDLNMVEISTLRSLARMEAYLLAIPFWITLVLGTLALVLTVSGLFSVISYLVEQRTREIGVRMALGATRRNISALVLWQSARPVGVGLLVGGTLTMALGATLLATPLADMIGTSVRLFDPAAYIASLLCIVVACAGAALVPTLRAGRVDPINALRQD
jgi:predicted permease